MNKRYALLAALLCAAMLLGGCRLAREEQRADEKRLVGVTIKIQDWGEPTGLDEEGNPYWEWPDGETPDPYSGSLGTYSYYILSGEDDAGPYTSMEGSWPGDADTHLTVTDEGENTVFTGTVYLNRALFDEETYREIYVCPVYLDAEGELSSESGQGMSGSLGSSSITISETESTTKDGASFSRGFSCSVTFETVDPLTSARMLAFDGENTLIEAADLPLSTEGMAWTAPANAAFLVLESTVLDANGRETITRQIASRGEWEKASPFKLFIPQEDGLCLPVTVEIH